MNSNSKDATYLIAKLNEDKTLTIWDININTSHKTGTEINLKFDSHGNLIPFNGKESASHSHKWIEHPNGNMGRKPTSKGENTHLPILIFYMTMIGFFLHVMLLVFNERINESLPSLLHIVIFYLFPFLLLHALHVNRALERTVRPPVLHASM